MTLFELENVSNLPALAEESEITKPELDKFAEALTEAYSQYLKRAKDWKKIEDEEYWNIWYEDNIGSFSVSIAVNS